MRVVLGFFSRLFLDFFFGLVFWRVDGLVHRKRLSKVNIGYVGR